MSLNSPGSVATLEQQLENARKSKTLAQVPALRRLRLAVRIFSVLALLGQLLLLQNGHALSAEIRPVTMQTGFTGLSVAAFWIYAAVSCISLALSWVLLAGYFRFLRQFKENHLTDLGITIEMMRVVLIWNTKLICAAWLLQAAMFQNVASILVASLNTGFGLAIVAVVLSYVKSAQAELPVLEQAVGNVQPATKVCSPKALFVRSLSAAVVVTAVGYLAGLNA